MKIDFIRVFGFEPALHGMRNPMDSWHDADSKFYDPDTGITVDSDFGTMLVPEKPEIGPKDMELARKLIQRGDEHRKFLRQIMVWVRLKLPRFVWQEVDTYKVATTRMSCSTMNKLGSMDLDQIDFECPISENTLRNINELGRVLRESKAEHAGMATRAARVQLKNDLPEGFLQAAMYTMSYETALKMLMQRESHRLPQWRLSDEGSICQFLMGLPYMSQFYEAMMWRRTQIREVMAELTNLITMYDDGDGQIHVGKSALEDLRTKLKRVAG